MIKNGRSLGLLVLLPFVIFTSLLVPELKIGQPWPTRCFFEVGQNLRPRCTKAICSFTFEVFPGLTWAVATLYLGVSLLFIVVRWVFETQLANRCRTFSYCCAAKFGLFLPGHPVGSPEMVRDSGFTLDWGIGPLTSLISIRSTDF